MPCDTGGNGYVYRILGAGMLAVGGKKGTMEAGPKLNVGGALREAGGGVLADGSLNEKGIVFAAEDDISGALEVGKGTCVLGRVDSGATFGVVEGSFAWASSFVLVDTASGLARLPGCLPKGLVRFLLLVTLMLWAVSPHFSGIRKTFLFPWGLVTHPDSCLWPCLLIWRNYVFFW
jgi:hypothetical protein